MDDRYRTANLEAWNELVDIHVESDFYDVPGFVAGGCTLRDFEIEEMGEVADHSLLHLQCHIGLDTLSWARRGARVTGLDFSRPAVDAAATIASSAGIDARFVTGDVLEASRVLDDRFDIVYTGLGALCWIDDLARWAHEVHALLRPGGRLYLAEMHPFTDVFAAESLEVRHHYFDRGVPFRDETSGTYANAEASTEKNTTYEWTHSVGEVMGSLLDSGLAIDRFSEHDFTVFQRFPNLRLDPNDRTYRFPSDHPRLPLMYSLRAKRPD